MSSPLKLLFNIPYELTQADRDLILQTHPGARLECAPSECLVQPDHMNGQDVHILVSETIPCDLSRWPNLKFVQLVSAGIDHLIGHPIWKQNIPVATASGIHSVPMAQFATCAILALFHRMREVSNFTASHRWPNREAWAGLLLRDRTVGIVGYGSVGRECARQLHALGMRVVCLTRSLNKHSDHRFQGWPGTGDPKGTIPERWFGRQQIDEMLPLCDVLLVTAPRTRETHGMICGKELALLKSGAHVVIISRGGIVDERQLAQSLASGQLGGAWVDCFTEEPPSASHPLFDAPNAILTPHMSGVFAEYWTVLLKLLAKNLEHFVKGAPLFNIANERLGY